MEYAALKLASRRSTVVQHSPLHNKVQGSNTGRDHSKREGGGKYNLCLTKR
jgi:hypothetical protein